MPNMRAKREILEAVENQVRENNPPETRLTLERLLAAGYTRQEAIEMIGRVVVTEIWHIMKYKETFNLERFRAGLEELE